MKAVEHFYKTVGYRGMEPYQIWISGCPFARYGKDTVNEGDVVLVRYDNGKLCTFRRKARTTASH